VKKTILV
jgi:Rrf2 family protein